MIDSYKGCKKFLKFLFPQAYGQACKYKVIVKYIISGTTSAVVDLFLLYFFTTVFNLWYLFSAGLSFMVAYLVSFSLQKFWTFRDNNKDIYKQMTIYFVVGVVNLFINTVGMYLLVDSFGVWYLLAQVIMGASLGFSSFLIYRFVIFAKKKRQYKKRKNSNINILIATGIFSPDIGGPATYVKTLSEELPKLDSEVKIITYSDNKVLDSIDIFRVSRKQNILFRYFKYFLKTERLAKWADVVYAHDLVSVGLPCAFVKILRPRIKLVVRLGGDFLWEKAYNNNWTKKPLSAYYEQPKNLKEKVFLLIYKFVLNKCDKIIFSTEWQKDIYAKFLKVDEDKTIVVDNAFLKSNSTGKQNEINNKNILFAGRLIKLKNLETVIKAIKEIKEIKLIITGEGPNEENLKNLSESLVINDKINFRAKMDWSKLNKEILDSFLVIVPSITEISPNLVLECIKLGKPILVTKECGFYNKYKDKLIFIDPFSEKDIRDKIISLLDEGNYNNYLNKIKLIDVSRGRDDLALEHYNIFKNL